MNQEAPIDISNVMLVVDGKATRVGFEVRDGKKVRVAKTDRQGNRLIQERRKKTLARLKEQYQNEMRRRSDEKIWI